VAGIAGLCQHAQFICSIIVWIICSCGV
jgi:hypothetical protein